MNIKFKLAIISYIFLYVVIMSLVQIVGPTVLLSAFITTGLVHALAFIGVWILFINAVGELLNKRYPKPNDYRGH